MITDEFIKAIPIDFNGAMKYLIENYLLFYSQNHQKGDKIHDECVEYYTLLEAYLVSQKFSFVQSTLGTNKKQNINNITSFFANQKNELDKRLSSDFVANSREKFSLIFSNTFLMNSPMVI